MGIDARILVGDTGNWQFPAWYRRRDEGPHRRLATRSIGGDGGATGDATTAASWPPATCVRVLRRDIEHVQSLS